MEVANILLAPHLPWPVIAGLALAAGGLLGIGAWRRARGIIPRGLALVIGLVALANPTVLREERDARKDVALVLVDNSPSQRIGERAAQTQTALDSVKRRLAWFDNLEVKVIENTVPRGSGGTALFAALEKALSDVPPGLFAGAILITDGQIHDIPQTAEALTRAPIHALITGRPGEQDRRLTLEQVPSYGLIGEEMFIRLRVDGDAPNSSWAGGQAQVTVTKDGGEPTHYRLRTNEPHLLPLTLDHGGRTILEVAVAAGKNELTLRNNRILATINGIRNRVRVLLISGEAHAGERTWRSLLKADPSVDLVHFTILRPPEKTDFTPTNELSLIAFPTRELFEEKLGEFDLVIFDRYRRRGVLPRSYLANVAQYVRDGGAVLIAAGPTFATPLSLARTPIGDILPGQPTGVIFRQGFRPTLSASGRRHPVTAVLPGAGHATPTWGRWFRMIDVEQRRGEALMNGVSGRPILLLDRVGEGRVAQLLSDHAWLWTRGFEGGGPQAELLRRLAHWLMKEPDLEENDLWAEAGPPTTQGLSPGEPSVATLRVMRRTLKATGIPVQVTSPSGVTTEVRLEPVSGGLSAATIPAPEAGIWELKDGLLTGIAAVTPRDAKEFADVRATTALLEPLVEATGGSVRWLAGRGPQSEQASAVKVPEIRMRPPGGVTSGRDWIGLRANGSYIVRQVSQVSAPPAVLLLLLMIGGFAAAWYREGR